MGWGDEIMGSGIARCVMLAHGKRTAFGDGKRVHWTRQAHEIFRNNPNVVPPDDDTSDAIWVRHYRGYRLYTRGFTRTHWIFDKTFQIARGEFFFDKEEIETADKAPRGLVIIEPNVKDVAPNKKWLFDRYQSVADRLQNTGVRVGQFSYDGAKMIKGALPIRTRSFREAVCVMRNQLAYLGPEGGLHHGAAAVGLRGVVIFGGFISPSITGYPIHRNIFIGKEPCGYMKPCRHCEDAMNSISVDMVHDEMRKVLMI